MEKNNLTFTEQQKKCISETDKSVAILAGAGSGKTAVLIERIKNIVLTKKANLSDIVAITFTEKAAGELIYRLICEVPTASRPQVDIATITTIDGFCTKILREDAAVIGISPDFSILEEHASRILNHRITSNSLKEMLRHGDKDAEAIIDEMEFRYAVSCIEDMIEKRWYIQRPGDTKRQWPNDTCHGENSFEMRGCELNKSLINCFEKIVSQIDEEKQRLGLMDFVDLEIKTLELLQNHDNIRKKHQDRIKHLLVDEYQDTSDLQTEIIKHIYNPEKNIICIVGDPGQSIYRFRGANPEGIHTMKKIIEADGGLSIELAVNFRSTDPIIKFTNKLFSPTKGDLTEPATPNNYFMPLISNKGDLTGSKVAVLKLETGGLKADDIREKEAEAIASFIKDINRVSNDNHVKGLSYRDIAILLRSFTDIRVYERALNRYQIPFYRSGGRTFLMQPEVTDIILCLRVLANPKDDTFAYGLARSAIIGLSDEECYKIIKGKKEGLFEAIASIKGFSFLKRLRDASKFLSVTELIKEIVEATHIQHVYESLLGSGQTTANIEKIIGLAETLSSQYDYTLNEFIDYIDDLNTRGIGINEPPIFSPHDNAVKLLTIHAAKGLEFKMVILADLIRSDKIYTLPYIISESGEIGLKLRKGLNPIAGKESTATFIEIINDESRKEELEQERLLYVATTRAEEMLILPTPSDTTTKSGWFERISKLTSECETINPAPDNEKICPPLHQPRAIEPYKPLAPKILTLTVSQLESYYHSPEEYYRKYVFKLPPAKICKKDNKMGGDIIGDIVHKVIYLLSISNHYDLKELILFVCGEYGYSPPEPTDLEIIEKYLDTYMKTKYFAKLTDAKHEVPFVFRIDDVIIRGTIDCIYREDDAYSIIDFKTDGILNETDIKEKTLKYDFQTKTYAIAARQAIGADIKKTILLFLHNGTPVETLISVRDLDNGVKQIMDIAESIRKGNFGG